MTVDLTINGSLRTIEVPPSARLIDILREEWNYVEAKHACLNGECGHCTVLLDGAPTRSCLIPAFALRDRTIVTLEGLMSSPEYALIKDAFQNAGYLPCQLCASSRYIGLYAILMKNDSTDAVADWLLDTACSYCDSKAVENGARAAVTKHRDMRHERY